MPKNDMQCDRRARAVAEDVGAAEAQLIDCSGDVIGQGFKCQRTINVGGVSVALELEGHHLSAPGKARQQLCERSADSGEGAVQKHKWLPGAMDLVVHLKAVHWNVTGLYGNLANRHEPSLMSGIESQYLGGSRSN